jgi:hypothetical protein
MRILNAKPYTTAGGSIKDSSSYDNITAVAAAGTAAASSVNGNGHQSAVQAEREAKQDDDNEKKRIATLLDNWKVSPECALMKRSVDNPHTVAGFTVKREAQANATFLQQAKLLARRAWLNQNRNPLMIRAAFGQTIFMALLCGLIYLNLGNDQTSTQDRQGSLFFIIANGIMSVGDLTLSYHMPIIHHSCTINVIAYVYDC